VKDRQGKSVIAHLTTGNGTWVTIAFFNMVAVAIAGRAQFRRFVALTLLVGLVAIGWRLLGHGGWHVLQHYISTVVSTTQPRSGPR
jgi:hypothetical protein